ncbi:DUF1707 domain-containing protein [Amycolatopsis nigrescens]|uniref:DUF1707 domain-containing protein n=1 Tax=Amycolatopsis nigrescens TaxID=381445 RepID=UPI00035CFB76|nr:DUF1707 domain-containing protein [Amycolatopsis nigrescens]
MTNENPRSHGVRASDIEREKFAHRIETANGEGRLSLEETDRRLGLVYDATYRHELEWLVTDLPPEPVEQRTSAEVSQHAGKALRTHAIVVGIFSVFLVARWIVSGVPFFWPAFPMFWLALSLVVHALIRRSSLPGGRILPAFRRPGKKATTQ